MAGNQNTENNIVDVEFLNVLVFDIYRSSVLIGYRIHLISADERVNKLLTNQ